MNFKAKGILKSNPSFKMKTRLDPLKCKASLTASGRGDMTVGEINIAIDEIPIKMTVPFRKKRAPVLIASVGAFKARISPFDLKVKRASFRLSGTVKTDEISGEMDGQMKCSSEIEAEGKLNGKVSAKPSIELGLIDCDE
ncbi:MAG: hypothetical protein OEV42_03890 [Deltaproteobacteria bacterium]|nr:hypothetical protein [Deltaproteobacteria bacterium]